MSTPITAAAKHGKKARERAVLKGKTPLVYFARFSGRPGHITIGRSSMEGGQAEKPRLGDHTRGAGTITYELWIKAGRETEQSLHRHFDSRGFKCQGEREWFWDEDAVTRYVSELHASRFSTTDWTQAPALEYCRFLPSVGTVGQLLLEGGEIRGGQEVEDLDDYQTPPWIIEAARLVLGHIDLDPATSDRANDEVVHADRVHVAANDRDGLDHRWQGRVWLNPPWSQDQRWAARLRTHYEVGDVEAAILALGTSAFDKAWWPEMAAYPLCIAGGGRPGWRQADGKISPPPGAGGAFFYLGRDERRFVEVFSRIGVVYGTGGITPWVGHRLNHRDQWDPIVVAEYWRTALHENR